MKVSAAMVLLVFASGCDTTTGSPTEAACDPGLELTWETFGQDFMQTYCVSCHRSFDSLGGVQGRISAIDETAGVGPGAHNTSMPKSGMRPSDDERALLADWLACGAP